jgi:hypothetical protein
MLKATPTSTSSSPPPSLLFLSLYARPSYPGTYHWALHISPPAETKISWRPGSPHNPSLTKKYHVKNILQPTPAAAAGDAKELKEIWIFEEELLIAERDGLLLARLFLGDVADLPRAEQILREEIPVVQDDKGFTCRVWVKWAWERLRTGEERLLGGGSGEGVGCVGMAWEELEMFAKGLVERKVDGGRYRIGWKGKRGEEGGDMIPTADVGTGREVVA